MRLSSFVKPAAAVLVAPLMVVALTASSRADAPTCRKLTPTIVGTKSHDLLFGTEGDDVIVGRTGKDVIYGLGGNDVICGGGDNDAIYGGDGADQVFGQWGNDFLSGGTGDDRLGGGVGTHAAFNADEGDDPWSSHADKVRLFVGAAPVGVTVDLAAGTAEGWGHDTFALNLGHTTLYGSAQDDTLLGSELGDTITSYGGIDTVDGRAGDDSVYADAGTVLGGEGNDRVVVGSRHPEVSVGDGGPGNDTLWTTGAAPLLGGAGDDTLGINYWFLIDPGDVFNWDGGDGVDTLAVSGFGMQANEVPAPFRVDLAAGTLEAKGHAGTATGFESVLADGVAAPYEVNGTEGPDLFDLRAHNGSDGVTVNGRGGDDRIYTYDSDDTIDGGPGNDSGDAGAGANLCTTTEGVLNCPGDGTP
jgi:Ca2+-binding RTX toxin-like protein